MSQLGSSCMACLGRGSGVLLAGAGVLGGGPPSLTVHVLGVAPASSFCLAFRCVLRPSLLLCLPLTSCSPGGAPTELLCFPTRGWASSGDELGRRGGRQASPWTCSEGLPGVSTPRVWTFSEQDEQKYLPVQP